MSGLSGALERMVGDARREMAEAQAARPLAELRKMIANAPPLLSLYDALSHEFGLIGEIKERSPSMGAMLKANVEKAPQLYRDSQAVKAISILTNRANFGSAMTMERLRNTKLTTNKPVLRKDFIVDSYQVYEARAFGADGILLMANVLSKDELGRLYDLARELGLDVLFETHTPEEIRKVPNAATIYGINCRSFNSDGGTFAVSRTLRSIGKWIGVSKDLTIDFSRFTYIKDLPPASVKIAESGVSPERCQQIRSAGFNSILVGTSLLIGPEPIESVLQRFEKALATDAGARQSTIAQH